MGGLLLRGHVFRPWMQNFLPKRLFFFLRPNSRGVALVLVLAFVVLLASIIVAFFSRAQAEQQISRASANQTKVKLLADGAIDTIIGDLKAEVADGLAGTTNEHSYTNGYVYYEITNSAKMVPARTDPDLANTNNVQYANLITYSGTNVFAGGPNRAGDDLTTATNSLAERFRRSAGTNRFLCQMPVETSLIKSDGSK